MVVEGARQLDPGEPGHQNVGDHEVDGRGVLREQLERLLSSRRSQHVVARPPEERLEEVSDVVLVVDEQDGRRGSGTQRLSLAVRLGERRIDDGKVHGEFAALPLRARHRDMTATLLDDAVHRGQAEAGSFAHRLRREERLEESLLRLDVHPDPVVGDQ